ncbi:MAG: hypothetical protein WC997_02870 [Porticoccaceae bacterium]
MPEGIDFSKEGQAIFQLDSAAKAAGSEGAESVFGELAVSAGIARLQVAEGKAQAGRGNSYLTAQNAQEGEFGNGKKWPPLV